jgi:hypothetical protein
MQLRSPAAFRRLTTSFAIVLGLQSVWILAAELMRPEANYFPINAAAAKVAADSSTSAATAARIGWPRGDLRTEYAIALNAGLLGGMESRSLARNPERINEPNDVAETAASLNPADARPWLLLATNAQSASNWERAFAELKMSYYTSSYSDELFPLRIQIVARSPHTADEELSSFIEFEIGVAIRSKPELKRYIETAYRTASPEGRRFFETSLTKIDPKYLTTIKNAKP